MRWAAYRSWTIASTLAVSLLCLVCAVCALLAVPMDGRSGARAVDPGVPELREQAQNIE